MLHSFDEKTYQAILNMQVFLGMPEEALIFGYGVPASQASSIDREGELKVLNFRGFICNQYVYNEALGVRLAQTPFNDCVRFSRSVTLQNGKVIRIID